MKKTNIIIAILLVVIVAGIGIGAYYYLQEDFSGGDSFVQTKAPHFVDSTPLHGDVYAAQPINITINTNFDLASGSEISVTDEDGMEWTKGGVNIGDSNTALKKELVQGMYDGTYMVKYKACWPDRSCHDGQFGFEIDSALLSNFDDMTGRPEVSVIMEDILFTPQNIIITSGTRVVWTNKESVGHFINTETHPEHTYFPLQNSTEIKMGDTYATTFTVPGQYNYHCSAHYPGMVGSIIVR